MKTRVAGYYKLRTFKIIDGEEVTSKTVDWFPNIVTNGGLDRMATTYDYLNYCQVGTGTSIPVATNSALDNIVGASSGTSAWTSSQFSVAGASPYYRITRIVCRLNPGQGTGNLSEIGMGWASSGGLFSRALILDVMGDPTTITKLSDEYLDVTYELRFYPEESDITGSITLTGNKGGTYDYTLRTALITTHVLQQNTSFGNVPVTMNNKKENVGIGTRVQRVYDGSIGTITTSPSGSYLELLYNYVSVSSYVAGTYTLNFTISIPISQCNIAGGIKSIMFPWGNVHYQIEFDTAIAKTDEDTLTLVFTHTWGRV